MSHKYGLDLLRGIAAFEIVGCHLSLSPRTVGGEWATALCDFNVGLFAAISGFLTSCGNGYIIKRASRLLPVYFVWSVFYVCATAAFDLILDGGALNARYYSLQNWVDVLFYGSAAAHLWFLICLFYGQVLLAVLDIVFERLGLPKRACITVLIVSSLIFLALSASFCNWWSRYPLRLLAFLFAGFVLKSFANRKDMFWTYFGWSCVMLAVHLCAEPVLPSFVRDYLLMIPVLLLFVSGKFANGKIAAVLAATSMGVYLIHPLFARAVSYVACRIYSTPYNFFVVTGEWIVVWALSFVAAVVLMRLPWIGRVVK